MDSEGKEIEPITLGRGGKHGDHIMVATMSTVRQQDAEDAKLLPVYVVLRKSAPKPRGDYRASVHQNQLLSGDHARDRESGSASRKVVRDPALYSSSETDSSGGEIISPRPIVSTREHRIGKKIRAPKSARDRDRHSDD